METVSQKARDILIYLALKYKGDRRQMMSFIKEKKHLSISEVQEEIAKLHSQALTLFDDDYPDVFRHLPDPPLVLFYHGNLSLIQNEKKCISYVGSRDASPYGLKMAASLADELSKKGFSIVSGMAKGIDGEAGKAALENGRSVAVLGSGINKPYPSSNILLYKRLIKEGLVLSEYPEESEPAPSNFPERNRLIAGLSFLTIIGEAKKRSGTLITASLALDMGKEVGCIPYHADEDSACNLLIAEGASIINSVQDVLDLSDG